MSKYVEELHNREDATTLGEGILFFVALTLILFVLGVVFWAAV